MKGHRDLIAWQKSMELVTEVYRITHAFPKLETQLEIALNLGYLRRDVADALLGRASEVGRLVNGLRDWSASRADS